MSSEEQPRIASIWLGWTSYEIKVTWEGYNQIRAIAQAMAVCEECKEHYSEENPNIAGLWCLRCFLRSKSTYTFMGPIPPDWQQQTYISPRQPYENRKYFFLDEDGCIRLTTAGPGNDPTSTGNMALTLAYWHFPRPEQAERNGQTIKLSDSGWSVYGDLKTWPVVVLQQGHPYYKNESLFVARRNGDAIQLSKRKPMHRQLLQDAEDELREAKTSFNTGDIYTQIAKRVGEAMEAAQEEPEPAEQAAAATGTEPEPAEQAAAATGTEPEPAEQEPEEPGTEEQAAE